MHSYFLEKSNIYWVWAWETCKSIACLTGLKHAHVCLTGLCLYASMKLRHSIIWQINRFVRFQSSNPIDVWFLQKIRMHVYFLLLTCSIFIPNLDEYESMFCLFSSKYWYFSYNKNHFNITKWAMEG